MSFYKKKASKTAPSFYDLTVKRGGCFYEMLAAARGVCGFLWEGVDIAWNKRLVMFEDEGDHVIAHFEDGSRISADVLIGCDGGASVVRNLLPSVYGQGLGGNNVLEDARVLCTSLATSPKPIDWPKLMGTYETEMFARTKIAVQKSENAASYFRNLK